MFFVSYLVFRCLYLAHWPPNQVPETKGVTLEEMEEVFGGTGHNLAVEDQQRLDAIHRKIGLITDDNKSDSQDEHRASDEKA